MLSVVRVKSSQAKDYYSKDDYYLETKGTWDGKLAEKLGFTGDVKEKDFYALIYGKDPKKRFDIQKGGKDHEHTAGVDMTFSAPKSVSVAGLLLEDERITEAHNQAVSYALAYIEENYASVREKINGEVNTKHSGNMLIARFNHMASRELDVQLHTHSVALNLSETTDRNGKSCYRAGDYKDIFVNRNFFGQIYRSEMAMALKNLGYQIEADSRGLFEIKGIPPEVIEEFSKRSQQIEERYQELRREFPNASRAKLREQATIETRKVKDEPTLAELKQDWNKRIEELGFTKDQLRENLSSLSQEHQAQPDTHPTQEAQPDLNGVINRAMQIATESEAAPTRESVLHAAAKISIGHYRLQDIQQAIDKNEQIIKLNDGKQYTTPEILQMEQSIVNQVIAGHNNLGIPSQQPDSNHQSKIEHKATPADLLKIAPSELAGHIRGYELVKGYEAQSNRDLTTGQSAAVKHILHSRDRIIAIQGDAGTGKTTMLDCVRDIRDKICPDLEIVGLSFTGKAASEIEEASQISSRTIASLVNSNDDLKGKLVVVDEASMLSLKDMHKLLDKCDEHSKLVLIGDTKQLQTIGQGRIFSSLQEKGAIRTVRMAETIRQSSTPEYKDIVDKLGNKEIEAAYAQLDKQERIKEIEHRDERLEAIVKQYLERPKDIIIVTASNKDREQLNKMIREQLIAQDKIKLNPADILTRESCSLTGVDKFYSENYAINDIVIANTDGVLGKAGSEARIVGIDKREQTITVMRDGQPTAISVKNHGQDLQVYREKGRSFAEGDKIIFLKNDKGLNVKNGQTGYIKKMDNQNKTLEVKLETGKIVKFNPEKQYKYISHGYAITDYKSQGQTEKHVIYNADTSKRVTFNQAYVGVTRGKHSVTIYTDDKQQLQKAMHKEQQKTSTLDHQLPQSLRDLNAKYKQVSLVMRKVDHSLNAENKYLGHGYVITDYKSQVQPEKHAVYNVDTSKQVTFNHSSAGVIQGNKYSTNIYNDQKQLKTVTHDKEQQKPSHQEHQLPQSLLDLNAKYSQIALTLGKRDHSINTEKLAMQANNQIPVQAKKPEQNVAQSLNQTPTRNLTTPTVKSPDKSPQNEVVKTREGMER